MSRTRTRPGLRSAVAPATLAAAALLLPSLSSAQEVVGRLLEPDGTPVPWALIRLVDRSGAEVGGDVTTAGGAFRVAAPAPGPYRLRAERIGFESTVSPELALVTGRTRSLTLTASQQAIVLEVLEVQSPEASCGLSPEEGSELLTLWTEIEKALELQVATEESGLYEFEAEIYDYIVDLQGRPINPDLAREQTRRVRIQSASGFYAIDPELLAERGYRWENLTFFAPDAVTLLSRPYQEAHCFRARRRGDRLGVSFEPQGGTGDRVEVAGTLWLDAASAKLETLEYRYVSDRVPSWQLDGGFLQFEQLPEGAWIVRRWWIRIPTGYGRRVSNYFREGGGRVLNVRRLPVRALREDEAEAPLPRPLAEVRDTAAGPGARTPAPPLPLPDDVVEAVSLFRDPLDSAGVAAILARSPDFASRADGEAVAARAALWRRAGQFGVALDVLETASPTDGQLGLVEVERSRNLFAARRPKEAAAAFRTACATGDSLTLEALWEDLRGLATSAELALWKARPVVSRCVLLGDMIAERALRAGLPVPDRLALHYERVERARGEWRLGSPRVQTGAADSLGRHPDLEFDDRGLIYLRMGEPDEIAYAIAGRGDADAMGNRVEGWRYDRPEGRRIYFFSPVTQMQVGVGDYRLLDAPWRAMGDRYAATQSDLVELWSAPVTSAFALGTLADLYLSFQALDPGYATEAYRSAQGGTELLQHLSEERLDRLGDIAFAADSVPDAPRLEPAFGFAWERLRFFDPASGHTTAWLVAAVRAGELRRSEEDGSIVYRLDLLAALRRGTAVTADTARTVVRLPDELDEDDGVVIRLPVSVGPGVYPFTLAVTDGNRASGGPSDEVGREDDVRPAGNWARGSVSGLVPSGLPDVSDIAVAADSGGAWTRDGETFLAITPAHVTAPDGGLHVYFEVYDVAPGASYGIELRVVPEARAERIWDISPDDVAFRMSFASEMPTSGDIGSHHLRLDLADTPGGAYVLGVRITESDSGRESLPVTTPVIRVE